MTDQAIVAIMQDRSGQPVWQGMEWSIVLFWSAVLI